MATSRDTHYRSVLKAVSYRLCAAVVTGCVAYFLTRRLKLSIAIASLESVAKILCFYLHERVWSFIRIGKEKHPLSSLPVNKPLSEKDMQIIRNKLKDLGYIDED
jgi:adenylylsulfate kinase